MKLCWILGKFEFGGGYVNLVNGQRVMEYLERIREVSFGELGGSTYTNPTATNILQSPNPA